MVSNCKERTETLKPYAKSLGLFLLLPAPIQHGDLFVREYTSAWKGIAYLIGASHLLALETDHSPMTNLCR